MHWKLAENLVHWTDGSVVVSFDENAPTGGLKVVATPVLTDAVLQLFGTSFRDIDCSASGPAVVRMDCCGSSIHATFAEAEGLVKTQVGWRVYHAQAGFANMDVVASVQTELLDGFVKFGLVSRVKAAEILIPSTSSERSNGDWTCVDPLSHNATPLTASCVLFRLPGNQWSYVEMAHPSNLSACEICREPETGHTLIRHRLFSCPLEKGVMLRARLRGVLLPRLPDCAAVAALFAEFAAADPPLGR